MESEDSEAKGITFINLVVYFRKHGVDHLVGKDSVHGSIKKRSCKEKLTKLGRQSNIKADEALKILEKCSNEVFRWKHREEFMARLTSKVEKRKDVKRLLHWQQTQLSKTQNCRAEGTQCLKEQKVSWAKKSTAQVLIKEEAQQKCRDMMHKTIKKVLSC